MQLTSKLAELVRACFTGIWIESHEHQDAMTEIAQLCRQEEWRLAAWDIERGLHIPGNRRRLPVTRVAKIRGRDPRGERAGQRRWLGDALLQNFHRFLQSPEIVQALIHQITAGKQNRRSS